jgi:hypothetical protein
MPNGGSDCCGTCWFNTRNKGEEGYGHAADPEPSLCAIRDFSIESPFYTYCGNHPHRRPEKDPIPIGPVYTGDSSGERKLWKASPDTEEVRGHLLALLGQMQEAPGSEYPLGVYADEIVAWQLGEFKEARALDQLRHIASFGTGTTGEGPFGRTRKGLVDAARDALRKIEPREKYQVCVDDNYHYMDESARRIAGSYDTLEEALEKCREITVRSLEEFCEEGISPEKLSAQWAMFGEDPFIRGADGKVPFSARKFITVELCQRIIDAKD